MISPAWEYWVPDPEVAEVLHGYDPREQYDSLCMEARDGREKDYNPGLRFGRGRPDAPPPLRGGYWVPDFPRHSWVVCEGCGRPFERDRTGRRYCSLPCRPTGRRKVLATAPCPVCVAPVVPLYAGHTYCSRRCYGAAQSAARTGTGRVDRGLVLAMYAAGASLATIGAAAGCTRKTVQRVVSAAGVPRRAGGYHGHGGRQ